MITQSETNLKKASAPPTAEQLIEEHRGFCALMALRIAGVYRGVDVDDLIQQGKLGILRAMETFEPERGPSFLAYAKHWMLQKMMQWVRAHSQNIRVPQDKFGKVRFYEEPLHELPGLEEDEMQRHVRVEETIRETVDKRNIERVIELAIGELSAAQARAIRAVYFDGLTEGQAAARLGITRGGVNMAKRDALKKLRQMKLVREELAL